MGTPENFKTIVSEGIEDFMASVPGEDNREWTSDDMAGHILILLAKNGCVRLSEDQEMPHMTESIAKKSLELVAAGAEPYTAGAGGMWVAVQQAGFCRVEPLLALQSERK